MATVLSLEDDRLSQRLIEKVFRNAGHDVLLAETVQAGLGLLRERVLVDLVVLDSHLGTDVGWTFLQEVRRSPIFQRLPVIVYTGYTERQEVLRYASLKVQAVHVKPIKAEVLLGELDRATRNGLRSQLLQAPEDVCARLKIDRNDYARLLLAGVTHLEEDREIVAQRMATPDDRALWAALDRLKQRPREIGIRWLDELAELAGEQLRKGDRAGATETMAAIDVLVGSIRQRAVSLLGPNNSLLQSTGVPLGPSAAPVSADLPPVTPPADLFAALARQVMSRPFWMYAESLARVRLVPAEPDQLVTAALAQAEPPGAVGLWLGVIDLIDSIPRLDVPDTAQALADVPGFVPACRRIVQRVTMGGEADGEEIDLHTAATRLGVLPGVVLAGVARIARTPLASPLELQPLRHHAGVMALVSLELGRLLNLQDPHRVAAASLAVNLGLWTLASVEPALAAIALATTTADRPLADACLRVAGLTPAQLGQRVLEARQKSEFLRESARAAGAAADAATKDVQIALGIVGIAERLAQAATAEDAKELKALRSELLQPGFAPWSFLKERGVDVPLDRGEIVEVAVTVASTAAWMVREATT